MPLHLDQAKADLQRALDIPERARLDSAQTLDEAPAVYGAQLIQENNRVRRQSSVRRRKADLRGVVMAATIVMELARFATSF